MSRSDPAGVAEAAARESYGKLMAVLGGHTRDLAAVEDALADAFAAALFDWPEKGCPSNPEAWLLTVARRKLTDVDRHDRRGATVATQLESLADSPESSAADVPAEIPDRRLALMFACAHPAIDVSVRAPLILQTLLGLNAETIASAFLVSPAAMGKRLVRAKEKIRQAGIPFHIPERTELPERLGIVLDAIYAAFAEGWTDPGGTDAARRDLTEEAIFLARLVCELLPAEPEALGLLALLLHAEARRAARRTAGGAYVPLAEQDPELWDWPLIAQAESLLHLASAQGLLGRYQLEAALQSAHVHRRRSGIANWVQVVQLYDALMLLTGSPVVAVNRALAVAEAQGPAAGLEVLEAVSADARLAAYQPYWAARAELHTKAGNPSQAKAAYQRAIGLECDPAVRRFLQERQAALPP